MKPNRSIIFLHGSSSSSKVFDPVVKIWNRTERLVSFDLPGHGDAKRSEDYSWERTKEFIKNKIGEIEGEILLIGNSLGGHLAMEIAPEIKMLKAVILLGSPPIKKPVNMEEAFAPNPYTATYYKENPDDDELEFSTKGAVFNRKILPTIRADFRRADPKVRSSLLNEIMGGDLFLDEVQIISNLKCKKYFVNGVKDPTVNFNYLKQIQAEALYPIERIEIDECGHYPTIEQPERFLSLLEKIVEDVFR